MTMRLSRSGGGSLPKSCEGMLGQLHLAIALLKFAGTKRAEAKAIQRHFDVSSATSYRWAAALNAARGIQ